MTKAIEAYHDSSFNLHAALISQRFWSKLQWILLQSFNISKVFLSQYISPTTAAAALMMKNNQKRKEKAETFSLHSRMPGSSLKIFLIFSHSWPNEFSTFLCFRFLFLALSVDIKIWKRINFFANTICHLPKGSKPSRQKWESEAAKQKQNFNPSNPIDFLELSHLDFATCLLVSLSPFSNRYFHKTPAEGGKLPSSSFRHMWSESKCRKVTTKTSRFT